jgi:Ribosomal protein L4/L1 family
LTVVEGWVLDSHKTKPFRQSLSKLDAETRTILLIATGENVNLERASRNLEGVTLVPTRSLGPYDLLRHDRIMLSRDAAEKLSRMLSAVKSDEPEAASAPEAEAAEKKAARAKAHAKKHAAPKKTKMSAAAKSAKPKAKAAHKTTHKAKKD